MRSLSGALSAWFHAHVDQRPVGVADPALTPTGVDWRATQWQLLYDKRLARSRSLAFNAMKRSVRCWAAKVTNKPICGATHNRSPLRRKASISRERRKNASSGSIFRLAAFVARLLFYAASAQRFASVGGSMSRAWDGLPLGA
jgi:hypothetical protein